MDSSAHKAHIPTGLKWGFTAFMAVLVPVYYHDYGPTNFLYFCDASLFLTLFAVWARSALAASMAAVGILVPQFFWVVDFLFELSGHHLTHMTSYMFNTERPLFLRGLSFFHGWLPFVLIYLVARLGYDKRGLIGWTVLAWSLCLISYFFLPPAGAHLANSAIPINVDYVWGMNDDVPQHLMAPGLYLLCWMLALFALFYLPTHLSLKWLHARKVAEPASYGETA